MSTSAAPDLSGWMGHDLAATPYLSPIGQIIRMSRLNRVRTYQIKSAFGVGPLIAAALRGDRPLPWVDLSRWQRRHHAEALDWRAFLPFQPLEPENLGTHLRICLACARYGFHAMVHQLHWIDNCPWHATRLFDRCLCGRRWLSTHPDNAGDRLLACACGRDAFDRRQGLLGMRRLPVHVITAKLDELLTLSRQEATRTTLVTAPGVCRARAYAEVLATGSPPIHIEEATHALPGGPSRERLLTEAQAIVNPQGSVILPRIYALRLTKTVTQLLANARNGRRAQPAVEASGIGIFVHRMPVMSTWSGEIGHRLHRWALSMDWADVAGGLLQLSLPEDGMARDSRNKWPVDDDHVLERLVHALYVLLYLDATAYLNSMLHWSNQRGDPSRHPAPKHRLIAMARRDATALFSVALTRTR